MPRLAALGLALLLPAAAAAQTLGPGVINAPPTPIGEADTLASGTTLNVLPGAALEGLINVGSPDGTSDGIEVNVMGGDAGALRRINSGSRVNVNGGEVVIGEVYGGSVINVTGGNIGSPPPPGSISTALMNLHGDSVLNVSGGVFFSTISALADSTVTITGSQGISSIVAHANSEVTLSGGRQPLSIYAQRNSDFRIVGGEFFQNGQPITSPSVLGLNGGITGTLEDGSPFVLSNLYDSAHTISFVAVPLPYLDTTPLLIDSGSGPNGLRRGQALTLRDGGTLSDSFAVVGATLNVEGGIVGDFLEAADSNINVSGGSIGVEIVAYAGTNVNISGGTLGKDGNGFFVGSSLTATSNSNISVSGGELLGGLVAQSDSKVLASGGHLGNLSASNRSEIHVSGGSFDRIGANNASQVAFYGTEFFLDGVRLQSLAVGEELVIETRGPILTGTLVDNSPFSVELATGGGQDFVTESVTLTITLVLPGDFDGDDDVDIHDLLAYQRGEAVYPVGPSSLAQWQTNLGENTAGDIDADGDVDVADALAIQRLGAVDGLADWLERFGHGDNLLNAAAAVPEPAAAALISVLLLSTCYNRACPTRKPR